MTDTFRRVDTDRNFKIDKYELTVYIKELLNIPNIPITPDVTHEIYVTDGPKNEDKEGFSDIFNLKDQIY